MNSLRLGSFFLVSIVICRLELSIYNGNVVFIFVVPACNYPVLDGLNQVLISSLTTINQGSEVVNKYEQHQNSSQIKFHKQWESNPWQLGFEACTLTGSARTTRDKVARQVCPVRDGSF